MSTQDDGGAAGDGDGRTTRVLVTYTTLFGHTATMAERAAQGARTVPGTDVELVPGDDLTPDQVRGAHAVMLGAAVHMGSADAHAKTVLERALFPLWLTDEAVGKVGAVFTVGGGYGGVGGGAETTQVGLLAALAECGMLLVPFPKSTPGSATAGTSWAPHGRTGGTGMEPQDLTEDALTAVHHHGAATARVARALGGAAWAATGHRAPQGEVLRAFQQVRL